MISFFTMYECSIVVMSISIGIFNDLEPGYIERSEYSIAEGVLVIALIIAL